MKTEKRARAAAAEAYNWGYVKQATLWPYEQLLDKLCRVMTYPIIRAAYNHSMPEAVRFARCLFADRDLSTGAYPAAILAACSHLEAAGIGRWSDLLEKISTRADCADFLRASGLDFTELIDILHYLLRWGFPFQTTTRELVDPDSAEELEWYGVLKAQHLMSNFELLERGWSRAGRTALARQTSLPLPVIVRLVHRADMARLPYVRRKTILPVCGAGYDSLAKLAAADLPHLEQSLVRYFQRTRGRSWNDFKSVIVLRGLVTGARALPAIVQT